MLIWDGGKIVIEAVLEIEKHILWSLTTSDEQYREPVAVHAYMQGIRERNARVAFAGAAGRRGRRSMTHFPHHLLIATDAGCQARSGPTRLAAITIALCQFELEGQSVDTLIQLDGIRLDLNVNRRANGALTHFWCRRDDNGEIFRRRISSWKAARFAAASRRRDW